MAAEEPIDNTPFPDNWLPIHVLAATGNTSGLDTDWGHNPALSRLVNAPTLGGGLTPLALAADKGNTAAMAWLLKRGADPRVANDDGLGPLALAARAGQVEALKLLLGGGGGSASASLLAQADRWGRVPLLIAVAHGHAAAFTCLLDAALAAAHAEEAVLERLYSTGEGNGQTTLLLHACRFGHPAIVRALLTRGADPCHGYGPLTPLGAARAAGSGACEALLREWERIYGLAKARAVDDAQQAAAHTSIAAHGGGDGDVSSRPASPSLAVATQGRAGAVAAEAVKGMADDTFAALLGMLGGKTTGEAVEDAAADAMEEEEDEEAEGMEEGGDGEEAPWDW